MYKKEEIMDLLEEVKDPEIPVISVVQLGIVRDVIIDPEGIEVKISPTYSGCPAMDVIPEMIRAHLEDNGIPHPKITQELSPPWTTDWITEKGKQQLHAFGIAPPVEQSSDKLNLTEKPKVVPCPLCGSTDTKLVSQFGSTPCKAAYQCNICLEPFDYFKCL